MLRIILFLICFRNVVGNKDSDSDYGTGLISALRNDANIDLSVDEEYEDLRAELLAYHSALASLASRKSMLTTNCWRLGGICINYKLCPGYRALTEVTGCKSKQKVCCFVWNQYEVRDLTGKGIGNAAFPWSVKREFGGEGVVQVTTTRRKKKKSGNKTTKVTVTENPVVLLRRNIVI